MAASRLRGDLALSLVGSIGEDTLASAPLAPFLWAPGTEALRQLSQTHHQTEGVFLCGFKTLLTFTVETSQDRMASIVIQPALLPLESVQLGRFILSVDEPQS